jgi:hypothetical protein
MTTSTFIAVMAATYALLGLLRAVQRRRYCPPSDHLVTVVGARRVRDGLSQRYWIRCRLCDLEHGPYDNWQAAWHDIVRTQITTAR